MSARGLGSGALAASERVTRAFASTLFGIALAVALTACTGIKPCAKRGLTESCECPGGVRGVRVCLPERVWDHCACGEMPAGDAGVAGKGGNSGAAGTGGMSGSGSSGTGAGGSSSGGSGGSKPPDSDEDAGAEPISDAAAGTGGMSGGGSGGSAGSAGSAGASGSAAPASAAYKACTTASDCGGAGASCESGTDPDDPFAEVQACAPACTDMSECPVPEGSYEAMIVCVDEHCRLDCSADLLQEPLTCPASMRCASTGALGPSYCF